jgi:prepilin-type N-terminal cleavage/methylation domain-containing protein
MRRAARAIAGFTLIEVLVVLVIGAIAYVMILGVPMRGASIYDLKSAARTLASTRSSRSTWKRRNSWCRAWPMRASCRSRST